MSSTSRARVVDAVWLAGIVGAAFLLVFVLPWHVPAAGPVWSLSWPLGFSNAAAVGGLGTALGLALARLLARRAGAHALPCGFFPAAPPAHGRSELAFALGVTGVCSAAVGALWLWIPYPAWGEAWYFIGRMDLAAHGLEPYRDFRFSYGPLLLQAPLALAALTGGWLTPAGAYAAVLVASWVAGLLGVHAVLARSGLGRPESRMVFALVALAFVSPTLGLNYAPLRFVPPLAGVVVLDGLVAKAGDAAGAVRTAVWAAVWTCASWLLSPEIGATVALTVAAQFLAFAATPRRRTAFLALAPVLASAAVLALMPAGYRDSVRSFAGGANSLPVLPTPAIVALLLFALVALPPVAAAMSGARDARRLPLLAGLLVGAGLPLAGALGRCDSGHVIFYGWGVFVLGFVLLGAAGRSLFVAGALVFVAAFGPTAWLSAWQQYADTFGNAARFRQNAATHPETVRRWNAAWAALPEPAVAFVPGDAGKLTAFPRTAAALERLPPVGTPLGVPQDVDRYLKATRRWVPEFHPAPAMEVYTPADVERKLADVDRMSHVLVPQGYEARAQDHASGVWSAAASRFLSGVLAYPVDAARRNAPLEPEQAVARRLLRDFEKAGAVGNLQLLRRRTPAHDSGSGP